MTINSIITTFIKQRECLSGKPNLMAYKDSANIWTIGYGQNLFYTSDETRIKKDSSYKFANALNDLPKDIQNWTQERCEIEFNKHIDEKCKILNKYGFDKTLSEFKYGTLLDFVFQFGDRPQFFNFIKENYKNDEIVINKFFEYSKQQINGKMVYVQGILKRRKLELTDLWFRDEKEKLPIVEIIYNKCLSLNT